jgi:hypothetical protein
MPRCPVPDALLEMDGAIEEDKEVARTGALNCAASWSHRDSLCSGGAEQS